MKVGVLVPKSNMYPAIGKRFVDGLRLALEEKDRDDVQLFFEAVGLTGNTEQASDKVQQAILQHNLHLITGFIGEEMMVGIHGIIEANRVPIIVNNVGTNPISSECPKSRYIYYNTMSLAESAYLTGLELGKKGLKKVAVGFSFYDAGYQHINAFVQGVVAGGGEIVLNYSFPEKLTGFEAEVLETQVSESGAEAFVGFFSGQISVDFIKVASSIDLNSKVQLYMSNYGVHSSTLEEMGESVVNVKSFGSWTPFDEGELSMRFCENFLEEYDDPADDFALMGYETGLIIDALLDACGEERVKPKLLTSKFLEISAEGPRGAIEFSEELHKTTSKHFFREVQSVEGRNVQKVLQALPVATYPEQFFYETEIFKRGGWSNPYFCA